MAQTLLSILADFQNSLAAAVPVGQTTATLSSAVDSGGVALPSGKYGFTIDGDTSAKEYIVCDLVGTALTNVQNITYQGVASAGFANYHRFGATVTVTDWAILSRMLNNLNGTTGFNSAQALSYDGDVAGLTGTQIPTVNYVLSVVNGGTVSFDQQVVPAQTAGENLTAQNLVYFKESDQKWWKVDADTAATFNGVKLGIALSTVSADATLTIAISGPVAMTGLTAGSKYYASTSAGDITVTAPANEVFVGVALSTTSLLLTPNPRFSALIGLGDPSTAAPFISANLGGNVEVYTADDTWTKPTGARLVEVFCIAGGGGGGGGGSEATTGGAGGGGGGGGGGFSHALFNASALSATETVTVGAGGTAGTGQSGDATGGTGGTGGSSSFGAHLIAVGGAGGVGGQNGSTGGTAGAGGAGANIANATAGGAGGAGSGSGAGAAAAAVLSLVPSGGGGGGYTDGGSANTGGAGGARTTIAVLAGGTAGTSPGGAGGAGVAATASSPVGGTGGGGGGSNLNGANGGAGGAGGTYGGGGGGGGGSEAGTSGAGGVGGAGVVIVVTY